MQIKRKVLVAFLIKKLFNLFIVAQEWKIDLLWITVNLCLYFSF